MLLAFREKNAYLKGWRRTKDEGVPLDLKGEERKKKLEMNSFLLRIVYLSRLTTRKSYN